MAARLLHTICDSERSGCLQQVISELYRKSLSQVGKFQSQTGLQAPQVSRCHCCVLRVELSSGAVDVDDVVVNDPTLAARESSGSQ